MEIYSFVMEATRRCNMRCGHCLRGDPQNKTMTREILCNFLQQIDYISSATFTGGEPTLPSGIKTIYDFMEICNMYGVIVGSFYIVSNAKVWRPEIPILVRDLYNFCDDNEISCFDISTDQYHDHIKSQRNAFKWTLEEALEYEYGITEVVSCRPAQLDFERILHEGRGAQYGTGKYFEAPTVEIEQYQDKYTVTEGDIYLNCEGNVIYGCDWSYKSQQRPENIICAASENFEEALLKHEFTSCEMV